ncbi:SulP family inorganic anion transporter [Nannocystaceae bacterium ST9]
MSKSALVHASSQSSSTTPSASPESRNPLARDLVAGSVVFLVALPLCLGIALASGAPLIAGIVSGVVGGLLVGALSGSQTAVSGPAAGLTAVVLAQIALLGSFEAFLLAVMVAGVIQIGLGVARAGALSAFVPTSVIKGLLAAIGVILVLKQLPHMFGRDTDPEGDMAFAQPDRENSLSELLEILGSLHYGAALIGLLSLAILLGWSRVARLRDSRLPAPLVVVVVGVAAAAGLDALGEPWAITGNHFVQVPTTEGLGGVLGLLHRPDFTRWVDPEVYVAGFTIAMVASIETLLNLEAVDRIDPEQRKSPANRELLAQGAGNLACGLLGGIPITAVVIRGSVNVHAGAASKRSAILHGALLLGSVVLLPTLLNRIPLACLAAILLVTGFRLASPKLFRQMWAGGRDQFVPFLVTVLAIVFTDPLVGLGIGMLVSLGFILKRHVRRPLRRIVEHHLDGEVLHIVLPDQLSFLNQTALERALEEVPRDSQVLLDAEGTEYIDPDVLAMIREYRDVIAPARRIRLSMTGFRGDYQLDDEILYVDYSTRELQDRVTPEQVLDILREGNARFAAGRRLNRDLVRQVDATAEGQHPLAVVLSCIDSRTPAEMVFDLGLGDIFSVRVAGNVISPKVLGSMEYGCEVAGARLIVVLGHTRCGAVTAAVELAGSKNVAEATNCQHLAPILTDIQRGVDLAAALDPAAPFRDWPRERKQAFVDDVARRNVISVVQRIASESETIAALLVERRIAIVGVLYDISTGAMDFLLDDAIGLAPQVKPAD